MPFANNYKKIRPASSEVRRSMGSLNLTSFRHMAGTKTSDKSAMHISNSVDIFYKLVPILLPSRAGVLEYRLSRSCTLQQGQKFYRAGIVFISEG